MANIIMSSIFPEWNIDSKPLGNGSYGVVFRAVRRDGFGSPAAIKHVSIPNNQNEINELRSDGMSYSETETYFNNAVNDFVKEIQIMDSFKGTQNIVNIEDYKVIKKENEIGWDVYIRMELLTPLNQYFYDHLPDESEIIKIGCDICSALELCAKRNVIHRDIKPENIFVNSFGDFKLGDFGIARTLGNASASLTQAGAPNYVAPEITKSGRYDATVDIYSLGLVLYRYANGNRLPFVTPQNITSPVDRQNAIMRRLSGEPLPYPPSASAELAEVILRACAYDPAQRFRTPSEMKNALLSVANGTYVRKKAVPVAVTAADTNATTAVRRIGQAQQAAPYQVDSFDGSAENGQAAAVPQRRALDTSRKPEYKRKSKRNAVIAVSAIVLVVLIGFAAFAVPGLIKISERVIEDDNSKSSTEMIKYSKSDEERISEIINEAEKIASGDDYDGAYAKIQEGLAAYPKSASLMEKEQEYYNVRYKRDVLDMAKMFAETDSLPEAIVSIKDAQAKQGDCAEYQAALAEYTAAYKTAVTAEADAAAASGDYASAVKAVNEAVSVLGGDAELSAKSAAYESSYVSGIITEVDALIAKEDYTGASAVLEPALEVFPNNAILKEKQTVIGNSSAKILLDECPPYEVNGYEAPSKMSVCGDSFTKGFTLKTNINNDGYAIFNLGKKYQTLEFDIGHVDGTTMQFVNVEIYLNGELDKEFEVHSTDMLKHITVDVTGITQFRIKIWQKDTGNYPSYGIVNAVLVPNSTSPAKRTLLSENFLITECPPYEVNGYEAPSKISVCGDSFTKGFTLKTNINNDGYAIFNLGKKYQTLEFDIGHVDGTTMQFVNVEIYLNGELDKEFEVHSTDMLKHITVDVTGITQFRIKIWQKDTGNYPSYGIVNAVLA